MERKVFQSRLLQEGSYDPNSRKMSLTFRGGETYEAQDVSPSTWEGLKQAPSPGSFYHQIIKPLWRFTKV